jgi:F-type H+-transporting ATPase subunit gamma
MANARDYRIRIRSVKNIAQVTRALQAVSASNVKKAMSAMLRTRPYATKAWEVLKHMAGQPGRETLHPLLTPRAEDRNELVVLVTGDRGLAGAYNSNIVRFTIKQFYRKTLPINYIAVGRKGRDMLLRRRKNIIAEFSNIPAAPTFTDISAIGRLAVDEFLSARADRVYLVYTDFINMVRQEPTIKQLLPLEIGTGEGRVVAFEETKKAAAAYIYEPSEEELLDEIVPRFTALQVYQAVLESLASEHAARMVAMKNATDSATDLAEALQLELNKARQQAITGEMLDIVGGVEALSVK